MCQLNTVCSSSTEVCTLLLVTVLLEVRGALQDAIGKDVDGFFATHGNVLSRPKHTADRHREWLHLQIVELPVRVVDGAHYVNPFAPHILRPATVVALQRPALNENLMPFITRVKTLSLCQLG